MRKHRDYSKTNIRMAHRRNETPRTRHAGTGRYAKDYLATAYPHLYVREWDDRR